MSETTAFALVIFLDLAAAVVTLLIASKIPMGGLFGGVLGAVCGIVFELGRIFVAMAITKSFQFTPSDNLGWLINLRLFNIPILVGLGFMAASAAGTGKSAGSAPPQGGPQPQ